MGLGVGAEDQKYLNELDRVLFEKLTDTQSRNSPHFMKHKGS